MLVIRMQRIGRKGHAQFRVVVQDSRRTPTSGRVVAALGSFNPHTKQTTLDKEKASFYLEHGAQPSDRVARLLKAEGVKLPSWVKTEAKKQGNVKNAHKRRSTRPPEPVVKEEKPAESEETATEAPEVAEPEDVKTEDVTAEVGASEETKEVKVAADEPSSDATEAVDEAKETVSEAPAEPEEPANKTAA
jgi:small subunit ribosomal protein S16